MGFGAGWYYNDVSGDVVHASAFTSVGETLVPGWHGPYATEALAMAHKGITGATAHANESVIGGATSAAASATGLTGINAIGDFFSRLTQAKTWERIGEVVLGLVLIAVGLAHITHAVPIATKVARTAAKTAVLA